MRDRNTETTPFTVLIINVGRGVRRDSLGEVSFFLGGEWTGPGGTKVVKATEAVGNVTKLKMNGMNRQGNVNTA